MDEKLNGDSMNNGKSIRTLIALDGKFKSMGIDSPNQKLQSCNNVKEAAGIEIGRDSTGDVSFSSYLFRAEELCARRSSSERNSGEGAFPIVNCRWVDNKKGQSMGIEYQRGVAKSKHKAGDSSPHAEGGTGSNMHFKAKAGLIDGDEPYMQRSVRLDRQASFGPRVGVAGRNAKDGELGVFDAESYFSNTHDEEKSSPRLVISNSRKGQKSRPSSKSKRPQITSGLISDNNVVSDGGATISRQPSSAASSMGSKAVQSDSQASWNSQSGLLSNGVTSLLNGPPLNQRMPTGTKIGTPKWKIACKCPCTSKKSVATNDSLLYQVAPTSLQSSHVSSPLSSNNFDSIRKSYSLDKTRGLPVNKDRDFANRFLSIKAGLIQKDDQLQMKPYASPKMGKSLIEIRPASTDTEEDGTSGKNQGEGFSFPILGSSSMSSVVFSYPKEKPRLSLQVLESSCCSSRDFQKQSSHTQRRPRMYSVDSRAENSSSTETRSSFSFPRISFCSQDSFDDKDLPFNKNSSAYNYHAMKLDNTHTVEDDRSDSSSDLFEIENLSNDIAPCTQYHMRTSSGRIQLKDCNPSTTQPEMDSEATGRHSCISSSAKQEEKHFISNVEIGRRSEGYISRSIVRDSARDFTKPTRNTTFLRSCRNNRAVYIASAPGSPIRGAQENLDFEQGAYFKKRS
ncbi:hypothetical protein SUGI_0388910 [Cryptomeria japonica]|nr:uncharacterized protein LOC131041677 isoform X2 [Cryptomeria japonica]GLJ21221.1 hypothetical protein SUGI_0388910 [Cryptomeria japonica]